MRQFEIYIARSLPKRYLARFDVEDVIQEALLIVVRRLDSFRGKTESELVAWTRRILTSQLLSLCRHHEAKKRSIRFESENEASLNLIVESRESSPHSRLVLQELTAVLSNELDSLSHKQQVAVRMRYFEAANLKDVGEYLAISRTSAHRLLNHSLAQLRQALQEHVDAL